jgi:hypothetical protein
MPDADPARIIDSLSSAGWEIAGHKQGVYVRLAWPDTPNRSLLVPLDKTAPEFEELLRAALCQLEAAMFTGQAATQALIAYQPDVYARYADEFWRVSTR